MTSPNIEKVVGTQNVYKSDEVTFWKGVAILMIILTHSHQMFSLPSYMRIIPMFGQMGCQMFFVLSCFGLCLSFEKKEPNYFEFLKRRIKSISVGYWLTIIISILLAELSVIIYGTNIYRTCTIPFKVLENVLFIHGLDPFGGANNKVVRGGWYIGTLVLLYMLFPILYAVYKNCKIRRYLSIILYFLCFGVLMLLYSIDNGFLVQRNSFMYFSFINQLPSFMVGFNLYEWFKYRNKPDKCLLFKGIVLLLCSFAFFCIESSVSYIISPFVFSFGFLYIYKFYTPPPAQLQDYCQNKL